MVTNLCVTFWLHNFSHIKIFCIAKFKTKKKISQSFFSTFACLFFNAQTNMQDENHPFYNEEIKPALTVINILLGLFVPATLFFGLVGLVIRPVQTFMSGGENLAQNIVWTLGGVGFPIITIWSIFRTWQLYKTKAYRKAFYVSISPIVFTCVMLVLFALIYIVETIILMF